jgi:hypothetical protein
LLGYEKILSTARLSQVEAVGMYLHVAITLCPNLKIRFSEVKAVSFVQIPLLSAILDKAKIYPMVNIGSYGLI